MSYTYRLTETDRYPLENASCRAVLMVEHADKGDDIEVVISPQMGMALIGFSMRHIPLLQKSRRQDFLQGRKGLGPVILPHFNQRDSFPELEPRRLEAMAHIDYLKKAGIRDPFQHGAGRYTEWEYETQLSDSQAQVKGRIDGQTRLNDIPLHDITGFDFTAFITYTLADRNLTIAFDIDSQAPVAAGIHYYYRLPAEGESHVSMSVESIGIGDDDELFEFSDHQRDGKFFTLPLDRAIDTQFMPVNQGGGMARFKLLTGDYRLDTSVRVAGAAEHTFESVVIYSPANADFVCIEPLSDKEPLQPTKKKFNGEIILHPILGKA